MPLITKLVLMVWWAWAKTVDKVITGTGGTVSAATRRFLILANYNPTAGDETDSDWFGAARAAYTLGESSYVQDVITTGATSKILLTWAKSRTGYKDPTQWLVLMQTGAGAWDFGATAQLVARIDGDLYEALLTSIANLGTIAALASVNSVDLDPCPLPPPSERVAGIRGQGSQFGLSEYAHIPMKIPGGYLTECSPFDSQQLATIRASASSQANWSLIRKWRDKSMPVLLYNGNGSGYQKYDYYFGALTGVSTAADYIHEQDQDCPMVLGLEGVHRYGAS